VTLFQVPVPALVPVSDIKRPQIEYGFDTLVFKGIQ
jgi:hypothetical protein